MTTAPNILSQFPGGKVVRTFGRDGVRIVSPHQGIFVVQIDADLDGVYDGELDGWIDCSPSLTELQSAEIIAQVILNDGSRPMRLEII